MTLQPSQCRAARGMLGWSQEQLAGSAGVSRATVADFEREIRTPVPNNLAAIRRALEEAGVVFLADGEVVGGGAGVRLK